MERVARLVLPELARELEETGRIAFEPEPTLREPEVMRFPIDPALSETARRLTTPREEPPEGEQTIPMVLGTLFSLGEDFWGAVEQAQPREAAFVKSAVTQLFKLLGASEEFGLSLEAELADDPTAVLRPLKDSLAAAQLVYQGNPTAFPEAHWLKRFVADLSNLAPFIGIIPNSLVLARVGKELVEEVVQTGARVIEKEVPAIAERARALPGAEAGRVPEKAATLREAVREVNRGGGKLRVLKATKNVERDGPLRVVGTDAQGRTIRMQGTEDFLRGQLEADQLARVQAELPIEATPLPPTTAPKGTPSGPERGLTARLRTTEGLVSPELRQALDENIQTYEEIGNRVAVDEATQRIATDPAAARERVLDLARPADPVSVAEGLLLFRQAEAAGDLTEAQRIIAALAQKGTAAGQEVQAFSIISKLSPEGMLMEANRVIRRYITTGGEKATAAVEKRLAQAEAATRVAEVKATARKIVTDAESEAAASLEQAATLRKQAEPTRRAANQYVKDLAFLIDASSRAAPRAVAAADRLAIGQAKTVLRKYAAELPEDMARDFLDRARALKDLPEETQTAARRALIDEIKAFTPVAEARATQVAAREQARLLKKRAEDLEVLAGRMVPEAKKRARNLERQAINTARRLTSKEGVALPDAVANNLMDRARVVRAMEPGLQQNRLYEALMRDIRNLVPPSKWQMTMDVLNVPRAMRSMWDASFMLRQGWRTLTTHPKTWASAWKPMLRSMLHPVAADAIQDAMATRPLANIAEWAGLDFLDFQTSLGVGEEFFSNRLLSRVPGYKGSERGFVVPGNWMRTGMFDNTVQSWFPDGIDFSKITSLEEAATVSGRSVEEFTELARLYNTMTGRGSIEWLQGRATALSPLFWSLRLAVSQVEPYYMLAAGLVSGRGITTATARSEAVRMIVGMWGTYFATVKLGELAGIWDTDFDMRSVHFGHVRIKGTKTWFDLTGGASPYVKLIARLATGTTKTGAGELMPLDRKDAIGRFIQSKFAPIPGVMNAFADGENYVGDKRDLADPSDLLIGLRDLFAPLSAVDIFEGFGEDNVRGGLLSSPQLVGFGAQTYETARENIGAAQNVVAQEAYGVDWEALPPEQRWQLGSDPRIVTAQEEEERPDSPAKSAWVTGLRLATEAEIKRQLSREVRIALEDADVGISVNRTIGPDPGVFLTDDEWKRYKELVVQIANRELPAGFAEPGYAEATQAQRKDFWSGLMTAVRAEARGIILAGETAAVPERTAPAAAIQPAPTPGRMQALFGAP
jgi:hypothetical protein